MLQAPGESATLPSLVSQVSMTGKVSSNDREGCGERPGRFQGSSKDWEHPGEDREGVQEGPGRLALPSSIQCVCHKRTACVRSMQTHDLRPRRFCPGVGEGGGGGSLTASETMLRNLAVESMLQTSGESATLPSLVS